MRLKQRNITVFASVSPGKTLIDRRKESRGVKFGQVSDVARQFGVIIEESEEIPNLLAFSAPKSRLQMFVEKLHFAGVRYWE